MMPESSTGSDDAPAAELEPAAGQPSGWLDATIVRVVRGTRRVTHVFFRVPIARHVAGQHVDVRLTAANGYEGQRSYSIASAPGAAELELAIECLDDGEVSPYFHDVARAGDAIEIRGPIGGHFVWRTEFGGPVLLVGGGSGVVPLMAMARDWARAGDATPMLLVYSARTWEELVFRDELLALEAKHPAFELIVATTRGPGRRPGDIEGRLERSLVRGILARWGHTARHAYVCGSNAFVSALSASLVGEGVPAGRLRTERYGGTG